MPGQRWEPTRRGAKALNRWLTENHRNGKSMTVYTVREISTKISPVPRPPYVYHEHEFTSRSSFTAEWMTSHMSASGLLAQEGIVYEFPPPGVPEVGDPGPSCPPPNAAEVHGWINTNY
jgi:hypothetical protein